MQPNSTRHGGMPRPLAAASAAAPSADSPPAGSNGGVQVQEQVCVLHLYVIR